MPTTPPLLTEITTRHQAHMERLKTHNLASYRELFDAMETEILGRLARQNVTQFTRERLEQQLTAIRAVMSGYYSGSIETLWRDQIAELATYEAGFEARALGTVVPTYTFALASDTQIMAALRSRPLSVRGPDGGKLLDTFYADWTGDQINRVSNGIRLGFAQGQTTGEIVRTLRDETFSLNRRDFEVLTRTGLQHSAMVAREETWRRNADIVKRVRWLSTLDSRTSQQCQALDSQVFPVDKGPRPPAHPGCRSSTVAELDERFAFLDDGATRSARDPQTGKVDSAPATQSYYGWLKTQPADVQDSIIGPVRGKLLRDGGLSAQRFAELQLGKRFEPLTLAEMKKLEPVAFIRAGL